MRPRTQAALIAEFILAEITVLFIVPYMLGLSAIESGAILFVILLLVKFRPKPSRSRR